MAKNNLSEHCLFVDISYLHTFVSQLIRIMEVLLQLKALVNCGYVTQYTVENKRKFDTDICLYDIY